MALRDAVYGAAVGDALGVPYEFKARGSFECTGMVGFTGFHFQPTGTWSDDTALLLATSASIKAKGGRVDVADIRLNFEDWYYDGEFAIDKNVFDVGNSTAGAITEGIGRSGVQFVHILRNPALAQEVELPSSIDQVKSSGFVKHTFEAAIWCFTHTSNYRDCVLMAVNMGDDTDTTACVAGALAGEVYGYDAIPAEWLEVLRGKDIIERCLF